VNVLLVTNCKVLVEDGSVLHCLKFVVTVSGPLANHVMISTMLTWTAATALAK